MVLKSLIATLIGICALFGHAFSQPCWETVTSEDVGGFDFEVTHVVQGPDKAGCYTYTYTIYRYDQGLARYKDVSHISFWFPCKIAAQRGIVNGEFGVHVTCTEGGCPVIELGGIMGMTEPALHHDCRSFWGFKLDECENGDGHFLFPNVNGVSYPEDPSDPHCVVVIRSSAEPEWGKWLIKGGCKEGGCRDGVLYDAGHVQVPTCPPPVPVDYTTWGRIKVLYR